MDSVYLDHAATTPVDPAVRAAMEPHLGPLFGNASEPHARGREARAALEAARAVVAEVFGASPRQVVFTSGGTEADNQAVFGLASAAPGEHVRVVAGAVEHPAVREPVRMLERRGAEVVWAPVDGDGTIDVTRFAGLVREGDRLAAVMAANNVTGVVQPLEEVAEAARRSGVPLHVDAVQAAASLPLRFSHMGAETMAISAHKLYGPKGVGCLLARDPERVPPLLLGGGQERGRRSGTENVAGAVGFAAAASLLTGSGDRRAELRDRLERRLPPGVRAVSAGAQRLPGHSLLHVAGIRAELLVLALDREGFAVSAGSACAAGESEPSHVLTAQGMPAADARCVIRVSIGRHTTAAEVDRFADALARCAGALAAGALAAPAAAGGVR
ncbi:MAG TPA: cysteine desulfurase family protein [Gaiellales bacterium]|nr:cysteine desulfurase family protein [Gaiellales bacterium]